MRTEEFKKFVLENEIRKKFSKTSGYYVEVLRGLTTHSKIDFIKSFLKEFTIGIFTKKEIARCLIQLMDMNINAKSLKFLNLETGNDKT